MQKKSRSSPFLPRPFSKSKTNLKADKASPVKIEFRVVFRNNGDACDPFATYSDTALHAALAKSLPPGMTGTLCPSVDSKGQPAVLVRAQASDINPMYELRAQVVSGDFMKVLTKELRADVKETRRSQRIESMRTGAPNSLPENDKDLDKAPREDTDLDDDSCSGSSPGVSEMTMMDEENIWEKIRLMLPWEEKTEKDKRNEVKRELSEALKQRAELRAKLAICEAKCNEFTEKLASMERAGHRAQGVSLA